MGDGLIPLLVIQGPTASGKSDLALRLAEEIGGEIVNADSMQVYRGMDIGTAKPSAAMRARVPHHLLDVADPDENFTAADFRDLADKAIADIHARGKKAIVVGGTGLYIRILTRGLADSPGGDEDFREEMRTFAREKGKEALLSRLAEVDPESAARLNANDAVRIIRALEVHHATGRTLSDFHSEHAFGEERYRTFKIAVSREREELYRLIDERVERMIAEGLVEEVRGLLERGYGRELKSMRSLGYKEIASFLAGEFSLDEAISLMKRDTRRYAKRQLTWLKKDFINTWFETPGNFASMYTIVMEFFAQGEGYG